MTSLEEISLNLDPAELPQNVSDMLAEASRRADEFYEAGLGLRYPKYVPSNPVMVHAAIACLKRENHLQGNVFCEWGCGFGIASSIAALLGFEAYGIEIEEDLAERAAGLANDLNIPVEILQTSYLPEGFEESEGHGGKDLILPEETSARGSATLPPEYDGLDPAEVDLFFVYPYPDQEEVMQDLFEAVAAPGAVLLMYREEGEISAYC